MGMKLFGTFLEAGLPAPQLRYEAAIGAGSEWAGYEMIAGVVRDVLPLLQKLGITTAEEVTSTGGMVRLPALVSAWACIGE